MIDINKTVDLLAGIAKVLYTEDFKNCPPVREGEDPLKTVINNALLSLQTAVVICKTDPYIVESIRHGISIDEIVESKRLNRKRIEPFQ